LGRLTEDGARALAIDALIWIAGQGDLSAVFLVSTGLSARDLRASADQPETLAAVLDFLLLDDRWIGRFADHSGKAPGDVLAARRALPGGAAFDWA
jgi:hypothetical protein